MRHASPFLLFLLAAFPLPADELRTLTGKNVTGVLASIDDTQVIVKSDAGPVVTPLSQVLAVNIRPSRPIDPGTKYSDIRLIDDTILHCTKTAFLGQDVELTLLSGAVVKLPQSFIVSLVRDAQNSNLKDKFDALAGKRIKRDRIVIVRDGELNALEGSLGDVDAKGTTIKFKSESTGTVVDVPFERLHGLVFYRTEAPAESPLCKVYDTAGNSLMAVKLAHDGMKLTVKTTFGASIVLPQDAVARLDFNLGKLTFLSDMEPAKVLERSGIGLVHRYRRDVNLDGEPILLDKQYGKGLSMHAYTELEYNLAGKYKELKAILGVDPRTGSDSQPKVSIYCDGVEQFSETISGKKIRPLALSVKDVGTLKIVVSSRNAFDLYDHVTLAEARVSQ